MRNITIYPVLNGWVAQVGCQMLAYTDQRKLEADFSDYLRDPEATEARILEKEGINRKLTNRPPPTPEAAEACIAERPRPDLGSVLRR